MMRLLYRYYALPCSLILVIIFTLSSRVAGLVDRTGDTSHYFNRMLGKMMMLLLGIRLKITGQEFLLREDRNIVIVANHQSYMDIMVVLAVFPLRFKFLSKQSVFQLPFIGPAMKCAGYISVDRKKSTGNRSSLVESMDELNNKSSLMIFPEGTIPRDGQLGKFHSGAFSLAKKTNTPVLPVTISGTEEILPIGTLKLRPGKVRVVIHPPVEPEGCSRDELLNATKTAIRNGLGE